MMKKRYSKTLIAVMIVLIFIISTISFVSCNYNDDGKIHIVTTIFPEYDWVQNIVKGVDNIEVTYLLSSGADIHSYQASVEDITKISKADLFIYVGGESDEDLENAIKSIRPANKKTISLMDVLGDRAVEEEHVEGMQEEDEHEEEHELDEHVWLSLKNAKIFINAITEEIISIDPNNKISYETNASNYISSLTNLDEQYTATISASSKNTILVADRFPFRYLVEDYSINYYAAFAGCSAEVEASFETIAFLAGKVDEFNLNVVLKIEGSNDKIAKTIINNTRDKNQQILVLDSLQSTTKKEIRNGKTYLDVMKGNLEILKLALQ